MPCLAVAVTDEEYPKRTAHSILTNLLDAFVEEVPKDKHSSSTVVSFPTIHKKLNSYQDPKNADPIMKVQAELDETKIELHKTIQSVLDRGQTLESLVEKSNDLSYSTKAFYKTTKKVCCNRYSVFAILELVV